MARDSKGPELPVWALPVGIVIAVLVVGFIGWRSLGGHESAPGKDVQVQPGMYDFRKAAASGQLGHRSGDTRNSETPQGGQGK